MTAQPNPREAIYPGSFDPITRGHLYMIEQGCGLFDRLVITVGVNPNKKGTFTVPERIDMIKEALTHINTHNCKIEVTSFHGLMVEFAKAAGAGVILRGVRSSTDYEYENQLVMVNERLAPEIRTVIFPTSAKFNAVSSSFAREIAVHKGDLSWMVTPNVEAKLRALHP